MTKICLLIATLLSITLSAQIPGIQQQPKWAMPFFFEDANGEKDTIWLGYDPNASNLFHGYDSAFNEFQKIDSSKFNVILCPTCFSPFLTTPADSAYKIEIASSNFPKARIGFINGKMPITMKWVDSLFYSDSLPYPDISPRPKARADLEGNDGDPNYSNFPFDTHLTLTDYVVPSFLFPITDSLFLDGSGILSPNQAIVGCILRIVPHNYTGSGIKIQSDPSIIIYPNPTKGFINIESKDFSKLTWEIFDNYGIKHLEGINSSLINLSPFPSGLYYIKVRTNRTIHTSKIMKL